MSYASNNALNTPVTLKEAALAISRLGALNTIIVQSEPGVGKTGLLRILAENNGDRWRNVGERYADDRYDYVYIDCGTLQYGDLQVMVPDRQTGEIQEYVSGLLHLTSDKPKVIMLDEVLKLPKAMKAMVTRLMRERTVGARPLPKGSIVFGTSNNAIDGVGDSTQAHETSRVTFLPLIKDLDQWMAWAASAGINPTVMAWARLTDGAFASYMTSSKEALEANPYVFNPYKGGTASYVCPRTLETAARYMDDREVLGDKLLTTLLAGTVGSAAAHGIMTFARMDAELVTPDVIFANPEGATIPGNDIVLLLTLLKLVGKITTQEEMSAAVQYVTRVPARDMQAVWATSVINDPRTTKLAARNEHLKQWRLQNIEYMA